MADVRVEMRVGGVFFMGEGPEKWVAEQLDKVLQQAPDLAGVAPATSEDNGGDPDPPPAKTPAGTLAKYLENKGTGRNQTRRFLATAEWLTLRGKKRLVTGDVVKALRDNHQPKLNNASQCLNTNVKGGYCEKDGREFFVTPDGRKSLK